jgi:hypothetical protein
MVIFRVAAMDDFDQLNALLSYPPGCITSEPSRSFILLCASWFGRKTGGP